MGELKDANTNPWYVLMTLYGEQTEEEFDENLHEKNRQVWNAWACQNLTDAGAAEVAAQANVDVAETRGWDAIALDVITRHQAEMVARNGAEFAQVEFPAVDEFIRCSEITFSNAVVLKNHIFAQHTDFSSATFTKCAFFSSATFTQYADFSSATFAQSVSFSTAKFTQDSSFVGAIFTQSASFFSVTFSGFAFFTSAKFGTGAADTSCHSGFNGCQFEKPTVFLGAVFHDSYPTLSGAVLHDKTLFTAEARSWPQAAQADAEEAKEACAIIRHAVAKQGLPEDEHFFFRREMHFAGLVGGFWDHLPYRAFGVVSNYGYSIARPAGFLAGLWLLPALVFKGARDEGATAVARMWHGWEALGFSFSNIFKFLGFQRTYFGPEYIGQLNAGLKLLSASQTVLGFVFLFFLGLGLRTRFRMR